MFGAETAARHAPGRFLDGPEQSVIALINRRHVTEYVVQKAVFAVVSSTVLFALVFVLMATFLAITVEPPYGWLVASVIILGIGVVAGVGARDELSKLKEKERM